MATQRDELEQTLRKNLHTLKQQYHVKSVGIFGSYARGEATEQSDVDLLVEFARPIGWEFIDLHEFLENLLGKRVDLVTKNALNPQLKEDILDTVVYI